MGDQFSRRFVLGGAIAAAGAAMLAPGRALAQAAALWNAEVQDKYSRFMVEFAKSYDKPIDCADLALKGLIQFAHEQRLPVRLFYFGKVAGRTKRRWFTFKPDDDNDRAAALFMRNLGAANVIDNTAEIPPADLKPGDLIMTRFQDVDSTGHTRVVIRSVFDDKQRDWLVGWMQGSLPPIVPEEVEMFYGEIPTERGVPTARRWRFSQFVGEG